MRRSPGAGRRAVPTNLRLLRGDPGHCITSTNRGSEPQPQLATEIPEPPDFLSPIAAAEWRRVAEELFHLRLVAKVDSNVLCAYCQAFSRWRAAEELLAEAALRDPRTRGLLVQGARGPVQNPLVRIADHASQLMVRNAAELGLTASARARIGAGISEGKDKFAGLIGG